MQSQSFAFVLQLLFTPLHFSNFYAILFVSLEKRYHYAKLSN